VGPSRMGTRQARKGSGMLGKLADLFWLSAMLVVMVACTFAARKWLR
jgi:hypothetical protein